MTRCLKRYEVEQVSIQIAAPTFIGMSLRKKLFNMPVPLFLHLQNETILSALQNF